MGLSFTNASTSSFVKSMFSISEPSVPPVSPDAVTSCLLFTEPNGLRSVLVGPPILPIPILLRLSNGIPPPPAPTPSFYKTPIYRLSKYKSSEEIKQSTNSPQTTFQIQKLILPSFLFSQQSVSSKDEINGYKEEKVIRAYSGGASRRSVLVPRSHNLRKLSQTQKRRFLQVPVL